MTRETVIGDTPARLATSLIVGADPDRREERDGAAGVELMWRVGQSEEGTAGMDASGRRSKSAATMQ
jgi:hypothetical protein